MSENLAKVEYNENGLPVLLESGDEHVLGCLRPDMLYSAANYGDRFPTIPEKQWLDTSTKDWVTIWRDQMRESSCVGMSSSYVFDVAWRLSGQEAKQFSPWWIYGLINGGRDAGARVGDAMMVLRDKGVATDKLVPQGMLYQSQFPKAAFTEALEHKAFEIYKVNSWEELGSAVHLKLPLVSGIGVGRNFSQLDGEGVVPLPDQIVGGHALFHSGLKHSKTGAVLIECVNSYGKQWGVNGVCWLRKEHWNPAYGFPFDSFVVLAVAPEPDDTVPPLE